MAQTKKFRRLTRARRWPSWSSGWDSIQDVVQPAVWNHWLKFSTIRLVLIEKTDMLSNYLDRFEKKNLFLLLACKALKYYSCCSVDRCWFHFSLWTSPVVFHIGIRPISPAFYNRLCFYGEKVVMLCVFGFALSGVDGSRVTWSTMTRWEGGGDFLVDGDRYYEWKWRCFSLSIKFFFAGWFTVTTFLIVDQG